MKLTRNQQMRVNQILRDRDIDPSQQKFIGMLRFHPTETDAHADAKYALCRRLYKEGIPFISEALTRDRKKRFDVLELIDDIDHEVETGMSKNKTYKSKIGKPEFSQGCNADLDGKVVADSFSSTTSSLELVRLIRCHEKPTGRNNLPNWLQSLHQKQSLVCADGQNAG